MDKIPSKMSSLLRETLKVNENVKCKTHGHKKLLLLTSYRYVINDVIWVLRR